MPYDRFTQEQTQKVFELLGINRQLDNGQRCIVSVDGAAPRLHRGVVTQVLENGYVVLLDGAATAQAVLRHQAWSERSPTEFIEIAMLTGTQRTFVSSMAMSKGIRPPSQRGKHVPGRGKRGPDRKPRDKMAPRSRLREPAFRMFDEGASQAAVVHATGISRAYASRFWAEWEAAKKAKTWPPTPTTETKK